MPLPPDEPFEPLGPPDRPRFTSGDQTVNDLLVMVHGGAYAVARTEELRVPFLAVRTETNQYLPFALGPADIAPPSDMARVLIYFTRATHAAVAFEAWMVDQIVAHPEDRASLERGRVPPGIPMPSRHPDRFDVLTVLGQARGGPMYAEHWRIETPASGPRTFHYRATLGELAPSNFNPLFVGPDVIRALVRKHAGLARTREYARSVRN